MKAELLQISAEDYHSNAFCQVPCYSNSIGKIIINQSPKHAWVKHPMLNPDYKADTKASYDFGTAAHSALLEGIDIVTMLDFPDWRTAQAKELRDAAREAGRIPLLKKDALALVDMMAEAHKAIAGCKDLGGLKLNQGKPEQTLLLNDGETFIKLRLDWLADDGDVIIDYKTTEIANPAAWMRSISNMGSDMQAALYSQGVETLTGKPPKFVFMIQEASEPYAVYFVGLAGQYLDHGLQKTELAIRTWDECMRTGAWPAYSPRIMYPDLPPWIEGELLEKSAMYAEEKRPKSKFDGVTREQFWSGKVK